MTEKLREVQSAARGRYRATLEPVYDVASFTADDTDNHEYIADSHGKGRATISVDNPANQNATVTVYGGQFSTSAIGDADVKQIGSFTATSANGAVNYETLNDPFPYYIIRVAYGSTPTDSPLKTCTIYLNLHSV